MLGFFGYVRSIRGELCKKTLGPIGDVRAVAHPHGIRAVLNLLTLIATEGSTALKQEGVIVLGVDRPFYAVTEKNGFALFISRVKTTQDKPFRDWLGSERKLFSLQIS